MQHDEHVKDWVCWLLFGQQQDLHVFAWKAWQCGLYGFYAQLVRHQEPLGVEFERVLHDNLFELYAR